MGLIAVIAVLSLALLVVAQRRGGAALTSRTLATYGLVLVALLVFARSVRVIPAGSVGIVDLFGRVSTETLKSGIQLVNPLARVVTMSVKTQEIKEVMDVPSKEGLTMNIEVSVLFHLDPDQAADVYRTIGQDYVGVILEPQFRSVTRGVTAGYEARALYTSEREHLAQVITADLQKLLSPRGVQIESTPMRRLTLPQRITQAIEEKLSADQESQRMEFVLLKEKQEAERKRIEASGVADFQRIVAQGISPELLRWKGIEATTKIAESQNSKVIVIGAGKDGLPLILGGGQ
jgi:regulator of protease activity HflC (stomatin/prohibitin superfamily)